MPVIRVDRSHRLIEVRLAGYYSRERAEAASGAVIAAIRALDGAPNTHLTLYNLEHLQVTSAETFAVLSDSYVDAGRQGYWARRVACYSPSALVRLQMGRLKLGRQDFGIFADRPAAMHWLVNGDRAAHPG